MSSPLEFTVAMWVQFEYPGETGTYFTLYSVDSEYYPTNRKVLMQAMNAGMIIIYFSKISWKSHVFSSFAGVYVNFFDGLAETIFLKFPKYVPIENGQWHHVAVTWSGEY